MLRCQIRLSNKRASYATYGRTRAAYRYYRGAAMTVLVEPFASVYDDRSRLGVILARGRRGFEAYAADDHSLGLFPSPRKAAAAITTTRPWVDQTTALRAAVRFDSRRSGIQSRRFDFQQSLCLSDLDGSRLGGAGRSPGDLEVRSPTTGISRCCARAASGHAAVVDAPPAPPSIKRSTKYGDADMIDAANLSFMAQQKERNP